MTFLNLLSPWGCGPELLLMVVACLRNEHREFVKDYCCAVFTVGFVFLASVPRCVSGQTCSRCDGRKVSIGNQSSGVKIG